MKKVKIIFAIGLQLAVIASIGSFVKWPYMNIVLIAAIISILLSIILFIIEMSKE
jgi:hypothetical protein